MTGAQADNTIAITTADNRNLGCITAEESFNVEC
ncbi:hypothetical protein EDE11_12921 [Methylomonas methanica]|uniref:Uncharacterized protein n=1 Tax=Methylomonas methanica TaxID=421 RepID=A0ABY2CKH7_METMH|nr:hypothetical protein EDE11_12921 [Methylomonas methanica]